MTFVSDISTSVAAILNDICYIVFNIIAIHIFTVVRDEIGHLYYGVFTYRHTSPADNPRASATFWIYHGAQAACAYFYRWTHHWTPLEIIHLHGVDKDCIIWYGVPYAIFILMGTSGYQNITSNVTFYCANASNCISQFAILINWVCV